MPEDVTRSLKEQIVHWAAGQPFNNVLLLAILGAIAWLGHYGLTTAIPTHLEQIQSGYEKLNKSHESERTRTLEVYDRWLGANPPQEPRPTSFARP